MLTQIFEDIKTNIPDNIQKEIKTQAWRKAQTPDTFLDPKGLTFPVKYNGEYRCDMIHAAMIFSAMFSKKGSSKHDAKFYQGIHNKAKKLSATQGCNKDVKLNEDNTVNLSQLFEVYTLNAIDEIRELIEE